MQRTDVTIEHNVIHVSPERLEYLKALMRQRMTVGELSRLRDLILDEELEALAEQMVVDEIAEQIRTEATAMLMRGINQ